MPKGGIELFRIIIPWAPASWNVTRNRWKYCDIKDMWAMGINTWAGKDKPTARYDFPVRLIFEASWKGRRKHDVDNMFVKPIIDGLVRIGFFKGDDTEFIPEVVLRGKTGCKKDGLVIIGERYV